MSKWLPESESTKVTVIWNLACFWGLVQCSKWIQRLIENPQKFSIQIIHFLFLMKGHFYTSSILTSLLEITVSQQTAVLVLFFRTSMELEFSNQHKQLSTRRNRKMQLIFLEKWRVIWRHHVAGFTPLLFPSIRKTWFFSFLYDL